MAKTVAIALTTLFALCIVDVRSFQLARPSTGIQCSHGPRGSLANPLASATSSRRRPYAQITKQTKPLAAAGSDNEKSDEPWPQNRLNVPYYLDGSLAGDLGFDPLHIARNTKMLFVLREAEMKHARLAMLAAVGWPTSELYHYALSQSVGLESLLAQNMRAPSVLNGGLNNAFVLLALGLFVAVGAILELELFKRQAYLAGQDLAGEDAPEEFRNFFDMFQEDGWDTPGNYGFDPLKFGQKVCGNNPSKKLFVQSMEIFNGRLAMLATVGYAVQEFVTGLPVVSETPEFFEPLFGLFPDDLASNQI